jgi:hypothetical protein
MLNLFIVSRSTGEGACGSVVVKALCLGSIPDEVNFLIYLILPAALGPGVYSASNRNEYEKHKKIIMFLGSKVRRVRMADNFTTICEPIVWTSLDKPYRPPRPVTGIGVFTFRSTVEVNCIHSDVGNSARK